jgi:microcystin degradation protein MlrC
MVDAVNPKCPPRIAIGTIFTESNHFGGRPTDLAAFERTELLRGSRVLDAATSYAGGMLRAMRERNAEIVSLLIATAYPGGPLTAMCYRQLKEELLGALVKAGRVDGVLMPLHGAAAAEGVEYLEGDLLHAVRDIVGPGVPIVASLDLHAHVTAAMVKRADALVACKKYPHTDTFETGERAARLLFDTLEGRCRPSMAMAKVPVLTSALNAGTEGTGVFAEFMNSAMLSTSVFLVHPYLDAPDMGSGGLVVTDHDLPRARQLARDLAMRYWEGRFQFEPQTHSPAEAIREGLKTDGGPILLVETADCCGGGAAGDSVATLRALIGSGTDQLSLAPVVDPEAAAICHAAGPGANVTLSLGHKLDPQWGKPLKLAVTVRRLGDGRFRYRGGVWDGIEANMGPSAVAQVGAAQILIMSEATYDWMDEQYRSIGMDIEGAKFIVVKNPMNYRQAYRSIAKAAFLLDTPGPTPPSLRRVQYSEVRHPYFPADNDIAGLQPTLLRRVP